MSLSGRYQRFRAPRQDGEILCLPSREQLTALLRSNRLHRLLSKI